MDEEAIKNLVGMVVEEIEEMVKDSSDKAQYVKWFLSELYNNLNPKYNLDGNQEVVEQEEDVEVKFFWEIDEGRFVDKSFGEKIRRGFK